MKKATKGLIDFFKINNVKISISMVSREEKVYFRVNGSSKLKKLINRTFIKECNNEDIKNVLMIKSSKELISFAEERLIIL